MPRLDESFSDDDQLARGADAVAIPAEEAVVVAVPAEEVSVSAKSKDGRKKLLLEKAGGVLLSRGMPQQCACVKPRQGCIGKP